jgi:hypothetical protein
VPHELVALIGLGGMARDTKLKRELALKSSPMLTPATRREWLASDARVSFTFRAITPDAQIHGVGKGP